MTIERERPNEDEQASTDAAPEGASEEARPDEADAEQQDPESGPAADQP